MVITIHVAVEVIEHVHCCFFFKLLLTFLLWFCFLLLFFIVADWWLLCCQTWNICNLIFRSCLISCQVDLNHNYEVILITYEGILFLSWEVLDVSPWRFLILPCNGLEFRGGCGGSNCYILWHRSHCLYSGTGMKATHLHDLCCCKSFTFPTGTPLSISLELSW